MSIIHPHVKLDIFRKKGIGFDDLGSMVISTFKTYKSIESLLSAYSARQREEFVVPAREFITGNIKKSPGMNEIMYNQMVSGAIGFYRTHKEKMRLPLADPATHHSVHFSEGLFTVENYPVEKWLLDNPDRNRKYVPSGVVKITVTGSDEAFYAENLTETNYKYLIVRPKMTRTGVSVSNWEVLLFKKDLGYYIEHLDANVNPRYVGVI